MNQEERSQRSRKQVLDAALSAVLAPGLPRDEHPRHRRRRRRSRPANVYHHFADKESDLPRAARASTGRAIEGAAFTLSTRRSRRAFPRQPRGGGLRAPREIDQAVAPPHRPRLRRRRGVRRRAHPASFYSDMANRFDAFLDKNRRPRGLEHRLRPGVSPLSAVMLASRVFLNYFCDRDPLRGAEPLRAEHGGRDRELVRPAPLRHAAAGRPDRRGDRGRAGLETRPPAGDDDRPAARPALPGPPSVRRADRARVEELLGRHHTVLLEHHPVLHHELHRPEGVDVVSGSPGMAMRSA